MHPTIWDKHPIAVEQSRMVLLYKGCVLEMWMYEAFGVCRRTARRWCKGLPKQLQQSG